MQHLLPDTAFLCDFRQIRRRVDVPLRAVRIDVSDREMQMLSARLSELLSRLDRVTDLDGYFAEVHIGALHLAAVLPAVFHGYGLPGTAAFYRDDLASVFSSEYAVIIAPDIHSLVYFLSAVGGSALHTERGGDEKEILPFDRE